MKQGAVAEKGAMGRRVTAPNAGEDKDGERRKRKEKTGVGGGSAKSGWGFTE